MNTIQLTDYRTHPLKNQWLLEYSQGYAALTVSILESFSSLQKGNPIPIRFYSPFPSQPPATTRLLSVFGFASSGHFM